ncbi:unnamed protein product [Parnassius mnemosyne]|uniref:CCHC-type domain-containing protein n=1 Tax=Parnassius mnemosyne TaxID=213953 RepID=A0AAV1LY89_9NEOP
MSEKLLNLLEETAVLLQKTQVNLKKCPKQRLTKCYIETRLQCIEEYWQTFKSTHQDLVKCVTKEQRPNISYFVNEDYFIIEDLYLCLKGDLKDMLSVIPSRRLESTDTMGVTGGLASPPEVKLPRIQLPSFGGSYEEWPSFNDLFSSLVHNNSSLSKVQKLHYLKSSIVGEAEALLKHIKITEDNYEHAWCLLKDRYGNKRLIVNSIMKRLFEQKKVIAQTAFQIKLLLDTTTECLNSLNNLQLSTDSWDPLIIFLVVQKLDPDSHKAWEEHAYKTNHDELPTWKDLRSFLESKFRTLELITPSSSISRESKTTKERSFHTSAVSPTRTCIKCNEEHTISHCKDFAKLTPEERSEFVRNKNLCYNCLAPGHTATKCRLHVSCKICHRRHHSLLHQPKDVNKPNNIQAHLNYMEPLEYDKGVKEEEVALSSHLATRRSTSLLATVLVPVRDENGHTTMLRALIDQGSQANFITERAVQLLRCKRTAAMGNVVITGVGSTQTRVKHEVHLELLSKYDHQFKLRINAYVMSTRLTTLLPSSFITYLEQAWPHLEGLILADPSFNQPGRVDMLLGVEVYAQIMKNNIIKGPPGSPCAQETNLGWILFGTVRDNTVRDEILVMHHHVNFDDMLQTLWEIDPEVSKKLTKDEETYEQLYKEIYTRNEDGRYIVKLTFKNNNQKSLEGNTRDIAKTRLLQLERRFVKNPKLKEEYVKVMEEYLKLHHMEEVPQNDINKAAVYLPHHPVVKETSEKTKIRIVFNALSPGANNVSLNDELLVGPQLQEDMRSLMMRWRLRIICFVADIEKMYRQILVKKEDADYQRILWRNNHMDSMKDYRLLRVTFGTASAPYLAVKTLQQVADDEGKDHPVAAKTIKEDFFMDDLMSGQDNITNAIKTAKEVSYILQKGGFKLQIWASNSLDFLKEFEPNERSSLINIDLDVHGTVRALGLSWNIEKDILEYNVNLPTPSEIITKRVILAEIQRLFDPLGWLTPTLLPAKIIMQKLWLKKVSWDDAVEPEIKKEWLDIRNGLNQLNEIKIPR